ncbi:MAG: AprI/Inh family metalloprotease inhibitor [Pseudolabrys sp.]
MTRIIFVFAQLFLAASALAQTPPAPPALGDSAQAVLGSWEFSNAERDKRCTATFRKDRTTVGFKVEFDANCGSLFPLVNNVAGWIFPDNDLLRLLDAQGTSLVEFSEVESGIYEAPTPGVGVLFLQNAAAAGPTPKPPAELAGEWAMRRGNAILCAFTLTANPSGDALALSVKPGCAGSIAQLNFTQWRIDRDELMLLPARGNPWRFEEIDGATWRRLPETADPITLVRQ